MTYHEIRLNAIRAAQNLMKRGFNPHDVFGFIADHSDHLVSIMVASIFLACPMATLHSMLSKEELILILQKSKPSAIFCDINACDQLEEVLDELPYNIQVFTFDGQIDGYESVECLFAETGEESHFM